MVASFGCSLSRAGFVFPKPLSQKHRSTFLTLQHAETFIFSVDWGLDVVPTATDQRGGRLFVGNPVQPNQ